MHTGKASLADYVIRNSANLFHIVFNIEFVYPECWHFDNDVTNKIDDDLSEHGGLFHVLPIAVHLSSLAGQVGGTILNLSYSLILDPSFMFKSYGMGGGWW